MGKITTRCELVFAQLAPAILLLHQVEISCRGKNTLQMLFKRIICASFSSVEFCLKSTDLFLMLADRYSFTITSSGALTTCTHICMNLKGIVHNFFLYRSNLIFWIVMGVV